MKLLAYLRRALSALRVGVGGPSWYSVFSTSHHDRGGRDGRAVKGNREDGLANPRGACSCRRDVPGIGCKCLPWESQALENLPTRWNETDPGSPRQFEFFPGVHFNLNRVLHVTRRNVKLLIGAVLLRLNGDALVNQAAEQKGRPAPIGVGKFHKQLPASPLFHSHFASLTAHSSKRNGPLVLGFTGGRACM